ncbi:MAG: ATP-binding protein [bacterium]|nr:ATP-binding protein [bacterium]
MIIDYKFENFRSFLSETNVRLQASRQTTFNSNLIRKGDLRVLPSVVIYGANASGKSNVIMSMSVMSKIVSYGSLSKLPEDVDRLETYPFVHSEHNKPMKFEMKFENDGAYYQYGFSVLVGRFQKGKRKIIEETLKRKIGSDYVGIFERKQDKVCIDKSKEVLKLIGFDATFLETMEEKLNQSLDEQDLFLGNGFKNVISANIADQVIDFFRNKMLVVSDFMLKKANITYSRDDLPEKDFFLWNKLLDEFVKRADFGPQNILFHSQKGEDEQSGDMKMVSIYECDGRKTLVPAELMESRGTLKLIDFVIPFQKLFSEGGVLVLDEFDAAIHPELIKGIIALFHDSNVNKKGAQLIFSTHNPIYLNNKIFRRDQILFVEKDSDVYESALYSLASFGSSGTKGVRNDENYLINYFKGKYSTLPYIDFAKIFEEGE